jgi:signal transduction histidine kinase
MYKHHDTRGSFAKTLFSQNLTMSTLRKNSRALVVDAHLLFGMTKASAIVAIMIIVIAFGSFFYLQYIEENNIKKELIEERTLQQQESTRALADHIGSDLGLVSANLRSLATSPFLYDGKNLTAATTTKEEAEILARETYSQINNIVDRMFITDRDGIIRFDMVPDGKPSFVGTNLSFREYVQEMKTTLKQTFSNEFEGFDEKSRIAIAYPILDRQTTGQYGGFVGASLPTVTFFERYGNVHNINSKFLVAFDRNATLLAVGASDELIGKNFFGKTTQDFINHNEVLNKLTRDLLDGKAGSAIYDYGRGERLTTAYPILVHGKPTYFVQVVTPTATIYTKLSQTLFEERLRMFSLLAGAIAAVTALIVFLIRGNAFLEKAVQKRTEELELVNNQLVSSFEELKKSNKLLMEANEKLSLNDRMQREFINIAAHELRTPVQPILGMAELLEDAKVDKGKEEAKDFIRIIARNARRLKQLSQDVLDAARIESQSLNLKIERFNVDEIIIAIVEDYKKQIGGGANDDDDNNDNNLKLVYEPTHIFVQADKDRISQVISNLLSNAVKFTDNKGGEISITTEKKVLDGEAIISVKDNGKGIDIDIMRRLFTRFATNSGKSGIGLGLYISKSIVEAHGGRIWAENNRSGKGATFAFSLPLAPEQQ